MFCQLIVKKKEGNFMFSEQKLENHYSSLSSETLHILRDEYTWAMQECDVHNEEQLKYIDKTLSIRGESLAIRHSHKILFLCKCGQSRIVNTSIPDNKIKMFIFEQYNVPCPKCKNVNMYTWKYLD